MKKVKEYELEFKGVSSPDYFSGVGVAFTEFDNVVVGIGNSELEAAKDAYEILLEDCTEGNLDLYAEIQKLSNKRLVKNSLDNLVYYAIYYKYENNS